MPNTDQSNTSGSHTTVRKLTTGIYMYLINYLANQADSFQTIRYLPVETMSFE